MKKKIIIDEYNKKVEREISYIPFRYIVAIFLVVLETLAVIAVMTGLTMYVPYFYFAVVATQFGVAIAIINRNDNPDYKLPWLFFVMLIPIVGFMLYFMFYSRKLNKKQTKRLERLTKQRVETDDSGELAQISADDQIIGSQAVGHCALIGPNCNVICTNHTLDADERLKGGFCDKPITIGDKTWLGANVTVLPGVTIGEGAVIGAGSVVTKDIPPYTVAVGNPCRVVKQIPHK